MLSILRSFLIAIALAGLWAELSMAENIIGPSKSDFQNVLSKIGDEQTVKEFLAKLAKITIEHDGVRRSLYVFEGDLLLTEEQVRQQLNLQASGDQPAARSNGELKVMAIGGVPIYWARPNRTLTYAIAKSTFPSDSQYQEAVDRMKAASSDWNNLCLSCGVNFTYRPEYDLNPNLSQVLFIVRYEPSETGFIAASFFPQDPIFRRFLILAPSFFSTTFDHTGVLRHELGHILGYRHEHISGIPGCYVEDGNWLPVTGYDAKSVMHYFCGGGGTTNLSFSAADTAGHTYLYR